VIEESPFKGAIRAAHVTSICDSVVDEPFAGTLI
jgi:hypothetical protein